MIYLILGLVIFFASHLCPTSHGFKTRLVDSLGLAGYRIAFSAASFLGLFLIIWGYGDAQGNTMQIWEPPSWMRHVAMLFMLPVFPLLVESVLPGQLKKKIRDPMLLAIKSWAFAHLLANGDAASMVLFGSFLFYGVYAMISAKKRRAAGLLENKVGPARNDIISLVVGLVIYAAFVVWLHPLLIGVPVINV